MEEGAHKILLGKPERKHSSGRPDSRWEDNLIWDFKEVDYGKHLPRIG